MEIPVKLFAPREIREGPGLAKGDPDLMLRWPALPGVFNIRTTRPRRSQKQALQEFPFPELKSSAQAQCSRGEFAGCM